MTSVTLINDGDFKIPMTMLLVSHWCWSSKYLGNINNIFENCHSLNGDGVIKL